MRFQGFNIQGDATSARSLEDIVYLRVRSSLSFLELDGKRPVSGIERLYRVVIVRTGEERGREGVVLSPPFGRKLIMELDRTIILRGVSSKMIFLSGEEGRISGWRVWRRVEAIIQGAVDFSLTVKE